MNDVVYTRDTTSGRVHRRFHAPDGSLASLEADNLDDAGEYEVLDVLALADVDPDRLCDRCFVGDEA